MNDLTGDCEIDCQEECAYPGEFSECELGAESWQERAFRLVQTIRGNCL